MIRTSAGLLNCRSHLLAHRLHRDPSEGIVHCLTHTLFPPRDGLQVAGRGFQVRMPEPQLDLADVATSKKVHARECVPELVKVELLANRVRLASDWFSEVGRVAMPAVQFATLRHSLEITKQVRDGSCALG